MKDSIEWMLKRSDLYKESSMLNWYPKIKDLKIPQPDTYIVKIPYKNLIEMIDGKQLPDKYVTLIENSADILGYPLFLRTDNSSQKHQWNKTCFVKSGDDLEQQILNLLDNNGACDLVDNAIILRLYIPMFSLFKAFSGKFPVSREMRYFIRNGKVQCKHWYWFDEVLKKQGRPEDKEWESKLKIINTLTEDSEKRINQYLDLVCKKFPEGYWSVDFCQGKDGKWYLLDMARGEVSFHYPTCKFAEEYAQT